MADKNEIQAIREQLNRVRLTLDSLTKRLELLEFKEKKSSPTSHAKSSSKKRSHYPPLITPQDRLGETTVPETHHDKPVAHPESPPPYALVDAEEPPTRHKEDKDAVDVAEATNSTSFRTNIRSEQASSLVDVTDPVEEEKFTTHPALKSDSLTTIIRKTIEFISPSEKMSWEMALGTYWLPRIAVVVLAIGITWLATLAIKKFGGPYMAHIRVSLGFGICGSLLVAGKWLESKAPEYARILMAAAFGMIYFITFATHYLPYTQIFSKPEPTLLATTLLVLIWAFLAHRRHSVLLAMGMVFLGEFTITAATLTSTITHNYAPAGIIMLAAGGIFFMVRHGWYHIGAITMLATNSNLALWFFKADPVDTITSFSTGMCLLAVHYLLFTSGDYFYQRKHRNTLVPSRWRRWYLTINSAAFFSLGLLLVRASSFASPYVHVFYALFGTTLLLIGLAYWKPKPSDPLFNVFFIKASALYVLTFVAYFEGSSLTISLTLETLILLISARRWQLAVNRLLALGVALVALASGLHAGYLSSEEILGSPDYLSEIIPMALSALIFLGLSLFYRNTAWGGQNLSLSEVPKYLQTIAWHMDFLKEKPQKASNILFKRQLIPHIYALTATLLILGFSHVFFTKPYQATGLILLGLIFVFSAIRFKSSSIFYASLPLSFAGLFFFHKILPDLQINPNWISTLLCWIPFFILIDVSKTLPENYQISFHESFSKLLKKSQVSIWSIVYLVASIELYLIGTWKLLPEKYWVLSGTLTALTVTAFALIRKLQIFSVAALAFTIVAGIFALSEFGNSSFSPSMAAGIITVWATALFSDRWLEGKSEYLIAHQSVNGPYIFYGFASWITISYLSGFPNTLTDSLFISITGIVVMGFVPVLHQRAMTCCAAAILIWGYFTWLMAIPEHTPKWHMLGVSLPLVALTGDRFFERMESFKRNIAGYCLIAMSAIGSLWYLYKNIIPQDWIAFAFVLVSFFYLAHGVLFRNRVALIISLIIGGLIINSFMAIVLNMSQFYNIDVFIINGNVPIIVSYGALFLLWATWERAYSLSKGLYKLNIDIDLVFCALMGLTLCLLCYALPALQHYYLTISWTISAVFLFVLAVIWGQKYLRYTGFSILLLSLGRVFIIDTKVLAPIYRISAIIFLSIMMLFIAYGYVYARRKMSENQQVE